LVSPHSNTTRKLCADILQLLPPPPFVSINPLCISHAHVRSSIPRALQRSIKIRASLRVKKAGSWHLAPLQTHAHHPNRALSAPPPTHPDPF